MNFQTSMPHSLSQEDIKGTTNEYFLVYILQIIFLI